MKKNILLAVLLTVSSIAFAQTRSALIHLKGGEVKEFYCDNIDSITFTPSVTFSKEIVATNYWCQYYGKGFYYVTLSDAPMDSVGLPTKAGQTIVRFYPIGKKSLDSRNAILPSGRYDTALGTKVGGLFDGENTLELLYCTAVTADRVDGYQWHMASAVANVTYNSDNTYNIDFRGVINDTTGIATEKGFEYPHVTYSGPLTFSNEDPDSYDLLTEDVVMVPNNMGGGYTNSAGNYGFYSFSFFNTPIDNEGDISGAGELLSVALLTEDGTPMDLSKLPGTYSVTSFMTGPYTPGRFADGVIFSGLAMGTNYQIFDEKGQSKRMKGLVKDGTVTITRNGTKLTFVCDLVTENGKKVTMNYTDDESKIIEQSSSGAPAVKAVAGKILSGTYQPILPNTHRPTLLLKKVK